MESNPTRMCERLVGLPAVNVLAVESDAVMIVVHVESRGTRPSCAGCGGPVRVKDRPVLSLVDLPCFGTHRLA